MEHNLIAMVPFGLVVLKFFEQQLQSLLLGELFGLLKKILRDMRTICRILILPHSRFRIMLMRHTQASLL
jgi:hypothetical protein